MATHLTSSVAVVLRSEQVKDINDAMWNSYYQLCQRWNFSNWIIACYTM